MLSPTFTPLVEPLRTSPLGYRLENAISSSPTPGAPLDRFQIAFTHCGHVLFNERLPTIAPDLIFGENDDFFVNPGEIKSWRSWNSKDPESLLKLLVELKHYYNEFQKRLIHMKGSERAKFELDTVQDRAGVEYLCDIDAAKNEVIVSIPLVEIKVAEAIPADMIMDDSIRESLAKCGSASLCIRFSNEPQTQRVGITASLRVPQVWTDIFGPFPKAPSWSSDSCLMDYIPQVSEHITDHVKSYQLRKNYILEFVKQLGGVLLEYDAVDWRKASVLLDYEQTCIVVHLSIPQSFPNEQPVVSLLSVSHYSINKTLFRSVAKCPFSPRWTAEEMVKRQKSMIMEALPLYLKFVVEETRS